MKTSRKYIGAHGNSLQFYTFDSRPNTMVVHDSDCQIERTYIIGYEYELVCGEGATLLTSLEQVKTAWITGKVWF